MSFIFEELKKGNNNLSDHFTRAGQKWQNILEQEKDSDIDKFSKRLQFEQTQFERECGGRYLGQEIMVWSAFAHLYSCANGFDKNTDLAIKLAKAFDNSGCSLEVKSEADKVVKYYDVERI